MPDYQMWLAMHDDCPWPGCGSCVLTDLEMDEDDLRQVKIAAYFLNEDVDVFFLRAVHSGLQMVFDKHGIDMAAVA